MGQDAVSALQLDHELRVGQGLDDAALGADRFLFGHADLLRMTGVARGRDAGNMQ